MLGYVRPDDGPKVQRVVDRRRDMQTVRIIRSFASNVTSVPV